MHQMVMVVFMSVFVCVSVKSHLTSGASVHPENAATDSASNVGENIDHQTTPIFYHMQYHSSCIPDPCNFQTTSIARGNTGHAQTHTSMHIICI